MVSPSLPILLGLAFPVTRRNLGFAVNVQESIGGSRSAFPLRSRPRWQWEISFEHLRTNRPSTLTPFSDTSLFADGSEYSSPQYTDLATLAGFWNSRLGRVLPFLYTDPDDRRALSQVFGTGDGATVSFQLTRSSGGFTEPVYGPVIARSSPVGYVAGVPVYPADNLLGWSSDLTNVRWTPVSMTVAGGVSDPLGGTTAVTLTSTAVVGTNRLTQAVAEVTSLSNFVFSAWVRRRSGSGNILFFDPAAGSFTTVAGLSDLTNWTRLYLSCPGQGTNTKAGLTLSVSGDSVDVYGAQLEISPALTMGDYIATSGGNNYGEPSYGGLMVYVNNVVQPSTSYTVSDTGLVTLGSAPAVGASVSWSGSFNWLCRFDDDGQEFQNFMSGLWASPKLTFSSELLP